MLRVRSAERRDVEEKVLAGPGITGERLRDAGRSYGSGVRRIEVDGYKSVRGRERGKPRRPSRLGKNGDAVVDINKCEATKALQMRSMLRTLI